MIELITISTTGQTWYLNKTIVNPNHIVLVTDDPKHNKMLKEGKIDLGFDSGVSFSKIQMAAASGFNQLIAVGSPSSIMEKINKNTKKLLKG